MCHFYVFIGPILDNRLFHFCFVIFLRNHLHMFCFFLQILYLQPLLIFSRMKSSHTRHFCFRIRWSLKNGSTLAAFKHARYIAYLALFGVTWQRGSLQIHHYLTLFSHDCSGHHTVVDIVLCNGPLEKKYILW